MLHFLIVFKMEIINSFDNESFYKLNLCEYKVFKSKQYFTIVFWNYDQEKKKAVISDYYEISS